MTLGELIKLNRKQHNMTQPELAEAAHIEQSYLSKLENDKCSPSFEVIQKVATALQQDAMSMIKKLDSNFISQHLAHIPEVAAAYSEIRMQHLKRFKRRFITAAMVVVFGVGVYMVGQMSLLFPEMTYSYRSDGVIKQGETLMHFQDELITEIGETIEMKRTRLQNNASRFDRQFLTFNKEQAHDFVRHVEGGRRYYQRYTHENIPDVRNSFLAILGMMIIISGCFGFWYVFKFKE